MRLTLTSVFAAAGLLIPGIAVAQSFDGARLGFAWSLPFAGMLLSIALLPLVTPRFWHRNFGKVALGWSLAFLLPFAVKFGLEETSHEVAHTLILEYIPFLLLLTALYTVAGGICVLGNLHGTPRTNTVLLAIGTVLASFAGTTGAAMLMIRPVLRANDNRKHKVHVVIFFIFLVANAGGSLTPLGDPPLFLGFLRGVDFFWTTRHLLLPSLVLCGMLLVLFYFMDRHYYARADETRSPSEDATPDSPIRVEGMTNLVLLLAILGTVLMSAAWKPGVAWTVLGATIKLQDLVRDVLLLVIILLSWKLTPHVARKGNHFTWGPMIEVAKLFAGIFLTIIPVIAILRAGTAGVFAPIVGWVTGANGQPINAAYFWLSGGLSSFLDNAPTYLVFFNIAGGDAKTLMTTMASTLLAISAGSVYMGAMTYIGNAPNFMVKSIAEHRQVTMPGFFGYMAWSTAVLLPAFAIITVLFFPWW